MKPCNIVSTIVLTGILSVSASLSLLEAAGAAPKTVAFGSEIRISKGGSDRDFNNDDNLPRSIQSAVVQDLSLQQNIPERNIRVVESSRETWPNTCLGVPRPGEVCAEALTEGWRVVVTNGSDRWTYRTNSTASNVRLVSSGSTPPATNTNVPRSVGDAVLSEVSRRTGQSSNRFRIAKAVRRTWPDGCLGVPQSGRSCTQALVEGWEITVVNTQNQGQRWIYRTDDSGRTVVLFNSSQSGVNLPQSVANAVLRDLSSRERKPVNTFQIIQSERKIWPDSCLGVYIPYSACLPRQVPGWQVTVASDRGQRWVYHTNEAGDVVTLNENIRPDIGSGSLNPTQIPPSELPLPLTKGMLFRAISSGGLAGRTYETVLMEDGTLIQVLLGPGNEDDSQRRVAQISRQQVRAFQRLLAQQQFDRYNRMSYSAPSGAADYITVTLTGGSSTTRYVDMVQDRLPRDLQQIIQSWNQIVSQIGR